MITARRLCIHDPEKPFVGQWEAFYPNVHYGICLGENSKNKIIHIRVFTSFEEFEAANLEKTWGGMQVSSTLYPKDYFVAPELL